MGSGKKVNLWGMTLFTICGILVLDTFVAPAIIGVSSITIWIITAIFFFIPYGLIVAELGASYPEDGGIYFWIKKAFGDLVGTINGWFYWVNVAFWMPAVFVAFSTWFSMAFFPELGDWTCAFIAIALCWLIVLIGVRGIQLSVLVTNIAAIAKAAVFLIFGVLGVIYVANNGFINDFSISEFFPTFDNALNYAPAIVYNLLGFELISSIASSIEKPEKNIPKMAIFSGIVIALLYVFGTFGVLASMPVDEIDAVDGFFFSLQELCTVFGSSADLIFKGLIIVALFTLIANMVSWTLGAVETLNAAELGKKSKLLAHKNKNDVPDYSYYIMGILATLLIVLNYTFAGDANEVFWTIMSFSFVIFLIPYAFLFPAYLKLHHSDKGVKRAYKVPGGTVGAWICAILCFVFLCTSIVLLFDPEMGSVYMYTLVIGTLLTTVFGFMLYLSGKKMEKEA